jgi:hypothetical protein
MGAWEIGAALGSESEEDEEKPETASSPERSGQEYDEGDLLSVEGPDLILVLGQIPDHWIRHKDLARIARAIVGVVERSPRI